MICYKCGKSAHHDNICPHCGTDMEVFQRVRRLSNAYYNDGLAKAKVRNLSGAILSLKKSLKLYRHNIEARNLLGLIYYETGEFVEAICEWVISTNFKKEDNIAESYLREMHAKGVMEQINQTVRKYNQAILYCQQGDLDLAEIQLKKVISMSPKYVKAHQLLALIYLQKMQLDKCKKTLRDAGRVDTDNTQTLSYLMECNRLIKEKGGRKKNEDDDLIRFQSGNELIIMPRRFKESSMGAYLMYMVLGIVLGFAVTASLVVPQVRKTMLSEAKAQASVAEATIAEGNQTISFLQAQLESVRNELGQATVMGDDMQAVADEYQKLILAVTASDKGNAEAAGDLLITIDKTRLAAAGANTYNEVWQQIKDAYIGKLYNNAYKEYKDGNYEASIAHMKQVVELEEDYSEGQAQYYLGMALRESGDSEAAHDYFSYIIRRHAESDMAAKAQEYLQ